MMKTLVLLLLCCTAAYGLLRLRKLSHIKFPYTTAQNFGLLRDAAHQAAFHADTQFLYVLGAQTGSISRLLWIVDISSPSNPQILHTHEFDATENGRANDVAVCTDTVAVSLESPVATKEGHIEFFTPYRRGDTALTRLGREAVGVDPKGLAFTTDCQKLVIANEGRGDQDPVATTFVDPPGSVTIMLRNDIGAPAFVTIGFESFLSGRETEFQNKGVRWVYKGNHNAGIVNKMSDDLEPESVAISLDQRFAYVSLPENNAVARIDINSYTVNDIFPLGYKNWTYSNMDASDQDGGPNWTTGLPLYSMNQATDIEIALLKGQERLITVNQGKIKRYTAAQGDEFTDAKRARQMHADADFDESNWPAALVTAVNSNSQLGRLQVRFTDAQDFISNKVKDVMAYGSRSLSLYETSTMTRTFDTGQELEYFENMNYSSTFNGELSNVNQSPTQQRDLRSDDHGCEPTSVALGVYNNEPFVAVGTRTGLIHLYSDQFGCPKHQSAYRDGETTQPWNTLYQNDLAGDVHITDIGVITADVAPLGLTLVYVVGSATGTVGIYEVYFTQN